MAEMSARERALRQKCKDDFTYYAPRCLKIRNKAGKVIPLELNKPQRYIHVRLEDQLRKLGMVRAVILKGRKQGCSTLIGARHYHKITHQEGQRGFILTHLADATKNLFAMVKLFHDRNNPLLKPITGASSTTELLFPSLLGGYAVGTAGSPNVGRSDTIQYLHGSEAAFWPHADKIAAGLIEAVPDEPGTESVLESTTNGPGDFYHGMWKGAVAGTGKYTPIFIPWFWSDEYRAVAMPDDFQPTKEEQELVDAHGLDDAQLQWRRDKIAGTLKTEDKFRQEYPCTPEEAFMTSGTGCYISPTLVAKARRTKVTVAPYIPIIVGIDPARGGVDRSGIIDRQGRRAGGHINAYWNETDAVQFANRIKREIIQVIRPKKIVIDATEGLGAALCDILNDMGFSSRPGPRQLIVPVKYSGTAFNEELYENVRAELYAECLGWLSNPIGVEIVQTNTPDDDELQGDLCAAIWGPNATRHTRNSRLLLESKDQIRKRLGRSPDKGDAFVNTFGVTVIATKPDAPIVSNTHAVDPAVNY